MSETRANEIGQKLVLAVGLVGMFLTFGVLQYQSAQGSANRTTLTVEERLAECKTHACIVKAGEVFPSLCHLKANGEFTTAIVECDDCSWMRRSDSEVFDCWRVEACHQDPECVRRFNMR